MSNTHSRILAAMPGTVAQLVVSCGLTRQTIMRHLYAMRKAKLVHIGGWERPISGPGAMNAIYHAGLAEDVPCPVHRLLIKQIASAKVAPPEPIPHRNDVTAALFGSRDRRDAKLSP